MSDKTNPQKVRVLEGGPYRVEGGVPVLDHDGAGGVLPVPLRGVEEQAVL